MTTKTMTMIQQQRSQSTKQELAQLKGYITASAAKELAGQYSILNSLGYKSGEVKACIIDVYNEDMYDLYQTYETLIKVNGRGVMPNLFNALPLPTKDDYAVVVLYKKKQLNSQTGKWENVQNEHGGYNHQTLLGDMLATYRIDLSAAKLRSSKKNA